MMNTSGILAIIPARGGSKGIPCKNIIPLEGKPLIAYTIEAARKSGIFDKIIVSSENKKIESISVKYGAQVIKRPKNLAGNATPTEPVILHALERLKKKEGYAPSVIFLLQPTSPLRNQDDIKNAYRKFTREKLDSLLSVMQNVDFLWNQKNNKLLPLNYDYRYRPRRQDVRNQFKENGAIYITKHSIFMQCKNRLCGKIGYYLMDEKQSVDIDSLCDVLVARSIMRTAVLA